VRLRTCQARYSSGTSTLPAPCASHSTLHVKTRSADSLDI